jgi:hypothetical protein
LEILEYCESKDTIKREQYYLDILKPEYNVLKIAGSPLGSKHTAETKAKMRTAALGRVFSSETLAKMAAAQGTKIVVTDITSNTTVEYVSLSQAAKALNSNHVTLSRYLKNQKLFQGKYKLTKK